MVCWANEEKEEDVQCTASVLFGAAKGVRCVIGEGTDGIEAGCDEGEWVG